MTATEWFSCNHPLLMLRALGERASDRKLRLFGCACCRRVWDWLPDAGNQAAVEVSERYADGSASERERVAAMLAAQDSGPQGWGVAKKCAWYAARAGLEAALSLNGAKATARGAPRWSAARDAREREWDFQAALLRDIFGNPFGPPPVIVPTWLAWNDDTVVKLTKALYEERLLPEGTLDGGRLAILADALEEVGCNNEEILFHLRQQGAVHVRGCWAVDLLTGKQ
jgi:hypothetical protein